MPNIDKSFYDFFPQDFLVIKRKGAIPQSHQVEVEGGVGALGRADSHRGEVELVDRVGGDRRHHLHGCANLDDDGGDGVDGDRDHHRRRHPRADRPPH